LEKSAQALRAAGLETRVKELETAAEAQKKAAKEPPPGKRLDDLEGAAARCEKRLALKKTARADAEKALQEAQAEEAEAEKELDEAKHKLQELQAELGSSKRDEDDAKGGKPEGKEAECARLRAPLARAESERDSAREAAAAER
jgi:chromosome segregation ATPase